MKKIDLEIKSFDEMDDDKRQEAGMNPGDNYVTGSITSQNGDVQHFDQNVTATGVDQFIEELGDAFSGLFLAEQTSEHSEEREQA